MSEAHGEAWTIRRVLAFAAPHFEKHRVDSPRLTAEVLLAHVLQCDRVRLYIDLDRPLTRAELSAYRSLLERRVAGEPTQYLTGHKEFFNRRFRVDPRVLIPRPETELLVELALEKLPTDVPTQVLDVCTGSGCIAITVACERPQSSVWAVDVSEDACAVARENAGALGVEGRVQVCCGDLLSPLPPDARFDAVISNPPYVPRGQIPRLSREVQREPRAALDGGDEGLDFYRRLIPEVRQFLKPGGLLALEIGEDQGAEVLKLLGAHGYDGASIQKDYARHDRIALGHCP